jgi:glycerophosphoryl diester phosphodiesterase
VPWTADTAADWNRLVVAGVDAIMTDDPAGLIAYLQHSK